MSASNDPRDDLSRRIDAVESGYEFLLAYAAQGRQTDKGPGAGNKLRDYLSGMEKALDGLASVVRSVAAVDPHGAFDAGGAFFDAIDRDAATARAGIRLVLSRPDIGSQLVDNLNASIHLRAVLTDLFVVDEALKPQRME
jgi:hypothetical protein